jgi:hypothetical protein
VGKLICRHGERDLPVGARDALLRLPRRALEGFEQRDRFAVVGLRGVLERSLEDHRRLRARPRHLHPFDRVFGRSGGRSRLNGCRSLLGFDRGGLLRGSRRGFLAKRIEGGDLG